VQNFLDLAIAGLAVYRLTRLIVKDEVLSSLRNKVWNRFPPEKSSFGYLLTCPWCISIWAASLIQISRIIVPDATRGVEIVLALSALAGLLTAHEESKS